MKLLFNSWYSFKISNMLTYLKINWWKDFI